MPAMARVKLDLNGVEFVFRTELDVRITDINYGRHVGNDAMLGLLHEARLRYESLSRFTGTLEHANGHRTVFVLQRQGLRWRLVDIRLPEDLSTYLR